MNEVKKATRDGFGEEIVLLGKENPDLVVLDVDIGKSCKTGAFRKELPEQYLNVGIAEQNGAGVAAGLATCGKIPFVVTYAAFGSMRMCEMIRQASSSPIPTRNSASPPAAAPPPTTAPPPIAFKQRATPPPSPKPPHT